MMSTVVGIDPDDVRIGMAVRAPRRRRADRCSMSPDGAEPRCAAPSRSRASPSRGSARSGRASRRWTSAPRRRPPRSTTPACAGTRSTGSSRRRRTSACRASTSARRSASGRATATRRTSAARRSSATCCTPPARSPAGLCEVALIVYGSTQRSDGGRLRSVVEPDPHEAPYRPRYPVSMFALAAARHMHEFGTTREQLAEVAVAARAWARLHPGAFARERAERRRRPVQPHGQLAADGARLLPRHRRRRRAARDRAPSARARCAARRRSCSARARRTGSARSRGCPTSRRRPRPTSGARAYAMAGVRPADVDVVQLYDAFTINTILFLEDLGFCAKGEGGPFVAGGAIAPGGRLAVNTNGGGLSYTHPGMYGIFLVIEAVRQLRGEAGDAPAAGRRDRARARQRRRARGAGDRDPRHEARCERGTLMRVLLVGGGCRGLDLTRALVADGHAVRAVTRTRGAPRRDRGGGRGVLDRRSGRRSGRCATRSRT